MKKRYAISDIHGNAYQFLKLLDYVDPDPEELVILGDFINRGLDSWGVVEEIDQLIDEGCTVLMGNHEDAHMKASLNQINVDDYLTGDFMGITTVQSFKLASERLGKDVVHNKMQKIIGELRMYHETDDFIFVLGGIDPRLPYMYMQKTDVLLYGCKDWKNPTMQHSFDQYIVFGHTPTFNIHRNISEKEPTVWMSHRAKKIAIDTGAGLGRRLTMVDLYDGIAYAYDFSKRDIIEYPFKRKERHR